MDWRSTTSGASRELGTSAEIAPSSFAPRRPGCEPRPSAGLHVCPSCGSEFVHPLTWEPAARKRWSVTLRCPDCGWSGGGVYGQLAVDRFDDVLEQGTEAILDDLRTLTRANMEDEVDRFVAALAAGQVLPEDF